jgi:uncharacterized Zn-finger protein
MSRAFCNVHDFSLIVSHLHDTAHAAPPSLTPYPLLPQSALPRPASGLMPPRARASPLFARASSHWHRVTVGLSQGDGHEPAGSAPPTPLLTVGWSRLPRETAGSALPSRLSFLKAHFPLSHHGEPHKEMAEIFNGDERRKRLTCGPCLSFSIRIYLGVCSR